MSSVTWSAHLSRRELKELVAYCPTQQASGGREPGIVCYKAPKQDRPWWQGHAFHDVHPFECGTALMFSAPPRTTMALGAVPWHRTAAFWKQACARGGAVWKPAALDVPHVRHLRRRKFHLDALH
eukprot:1144129-Pelagomonas_calceolata.AAC.2